MSTVVKKAGNDAAGKKIGYVLVGLTVPRYEEENPENTQSEWGTQKVLAGKPKKGNLERVIYVKGHVLSTSGRTELYIATPSVLLNRKPMLALYSNKF